MGRKRRDWRKENRLLADLTAGAIRYVAALRRGDELAPAFWHELKGLAATCLTAGCTVRQVMEAAGRGGLPDRRELIERAEYLEEVAVGLPSDLQMIIRGGR